MTCFHRLWSALVLLAVASGAFAQTPGVDDLIARNLAAKGGADALRALTSVKMTGRIKGPAGAEPVTSWAKRPNLRRRENVREGQTFVLGFDGKTLIHPSHILACNAIFTPPEEEVALARKIIAAFQQPENASRGAIQLDGRMVERLHAEMARRTIAIADAIAASA